MEDIKRNYVGFTLLFTSLILTFVDLTSCMIVNGMGIIAFIYTKQIVKYIAKVEEGRLRDQPFYDTRDRFQNDKDFYDFRDNYEKSFKNNRR
ncbi:hypothetical protein D3C87_409270 [compost metagenome]